MKNELTKAEDSAVLLFIKNIRKLLGKSFLKAVLFGSRSRGEGNEESDIDILVLIDDVTLKKKHIVWDAAHDILLDTEIYISPLVMSKKQFEQLRNHERMIAKEIDRDGVIL